MVTQLARDIDFGGPRVGVGETALLQRVGLVLNSTLESSEVLKRLADITRELLEGDRCSILLLDGDQLGPAVCIGESVDEELWAAFRAMGPIHVNRSRSIEEVLEGRRAVG